MQLILNMLLLLGQSGVLSNTTKSNSRENRPSGFPQQNRGGYRSTSAHFMHLMPVYISHQDVLRFRSSCTSQWAVLHHTFSILISTHSRRRPRRMLPRFPRCIGSRPA
ncbi:hypothetical protein BC936DRAFT_141777 [Jimgerdemannia flammicorona]|uniref:Secreted protein n=1 Tax=Jimgerdemannia flammicorona TaxID=994334 RepID=A0A433DN20_9FUNG|nr:hypothetical protein BC936DRAFT_141777 [Jimgerdemannia flammicorona]